MDSPELVNQQQLAQLIGYDERQIRRWLNHPQSPGKTGKLYDVEKWKAFAAAYGRKSPTERKAELEAERIDIANRRQIWKHECEQGEWTPNVEIDPALQQFSMGLVGHLEELLERRLPKLCANKSADALREWGRREFDDLMRRFKQGAAQINAQLAAPAGEEAGS